MKRLIGLFILLAAVFLIGKNFEQIRKRIKIPYFKPNALLFVVIAVIFLGLGLLIGKGSDFLGNIKGKFASVASSVHLPVMKANKVFVLSNFESESDFKKWQTRSVHLELSKEFVKEGKYSAKAVFAGNVESSNLLMQDYLEEHPDVGNWAPYNEFVFSVFSDTSDTERLILKIKDADDRTWQRNIFLAPKQYNDIRVFISDIKDGLDPSKIRQVNFFRWDPKSEVTLYFDNMKLMPSAMNAESGQEPAGKVGEFFFDPQDKTLGLGVASSAEKVFLEPNKFKGNATDEVSLSLACNEYEAKQLVLYTKEPMENVHAEASGLLSLDGKSAIDARNIKCLVVGYVKTQRPGYAVSYVGWWPDPLEEKTSFNVKKEELQPLWIQVYAPSDAPPGDYQGTITLRWNNNRTKTVKLNVKVWNFSLPLETHLATAFDFYGGRMRKMYPQQSGESAEAYNNRLKELETAYYMDMIRHRLMPVFNFDLNDVFFAKSIQGYLSQGLSAFAIGKYGGSFDNNWPQDPQKQEEVVQEYRDYAGILKASGLIDKAYLYTYDEPKFGDPRVQEITKLIHRADPQLRNMVCMHQMSNPDNYPGWGDDIDIWCIRNVAYNEQIAKKFTDKGKEVWIYLSGPEPPYPNLVIDYPAMAYRIVPWQCWKYGIKGYLYWCVDFWNGNPWLDPMNTKWEQNGNGFLYYPGENGPVTSIRLEVTRDGMEDYEYLYLLSQKIAAAKKLDAGNPAIAEAERLLEVPSELTASMAEYSKNPGLLEERREKIAHAIEGLSGAKAAAVAPTSTTNITEDFSVPMSATPGMRFGKEGQLTFELYRNGTFIIDGKSGFSWQKSDSYLDSAFIRSTNPLPKTYKVSAVVGDIDYGLDKLNGLVNDPQYTEGPLGENGVYLLAILDEPPVGHHTNDWWYQHRKACIDVDNNVLGKGMPNPVFFTFYDKDDRMQALSTENKRWGSAWDKAYTYDPHAWYTVEIEKTNEKYILRISDEQGTLLAAGSFPIQAAWHSDGYPDYFVIGDPHENYYQGSMKIKSITIESQI